MSDGWQNKWGGMRLADFRAGKTLQVVGASDLPADNGRWVAAFREALAEFREMLQPGDELYYYCSNQEEWDMGFGSEGYAIVRDGELLDTLLMRMN